MGCITSKVMSRSGSYQEELSRSLKRRHQSFPGLEELLVSSSRKGGDQFIALVCNVDGKQQPTKISSVSIENSESIGNIKQSDGDKKHLSPETINAWDMMAGLDEQGQLEEEEEDDTQKHIYSKTKLPSPPPREFDGLTNITRRSKSCQWLSSDNESSFVMKEHGLHNEESPGNIIVRSRSFHTVDEYDAIMMQRNGWLNTNANSVWEGRLEDYLTNINRLQSPTSLVNMTKTSYEDVGDRTEVQHEMEGTFYIESEDIALRANSPEDVYRASSSLASSSATDMVGYKMGNPIDEDEKKVQRMARKKDLKSLSIPSIIEFPVVRSLNGWIDDTDVNKGQVTNYSPAGEYGYYVTPRFGSFGLPILPSREEWFEVAEEESVFDPAMVSSYEVTMEQLEVEDEFLLKLQVL